MMLKRFLYIFKFFVFILLLIIIFYFGFFNKDKNPTLNQKIYKTKFLWQVLDSETPLKDATILAKLGIQDYNVANYIYDINDHKLYENIHFDLNYNEHNKSLNIKRIYFQGIGAINDVCWKYLEEITIPINIIRNNELSYDTINNEFTCIDDYNKNNALSLNLDIDNKGYLIKKELIGTTLQKKDSLENILIYFYNDKNLLIYSNAQTKQNLYIEKQKNKEIYKDKNGNIIKIYEAITTYSPKYKQNKIQKIYVKNNKEELLETVIFDYY